MLKSKEQEATAKEIYTLYKGACKSLAKLNFDSTETTVQSIAEILRQANERPYANEWPHEDWDPPQNVTWLNSILKSSTASSYLRNLATKIACDCEPVKCQHSIVETKTVPKNCICTACDEPIFRNDEANHISDGQLWLCDSCGDFVRDIIYPAFRASYKIEDTIYAAYDCAVQSMYEKALVLTDQALEWTRMAHLLPGANPLRASKKRANKGI